jgi:hypothetical protein
MINNKEMERNADSSLERPNGKGGDCLPKPRLPPLPRKVKIKRAQPLYGPENLPKILTRPLVPTNQPCK